MLNLFRRTTTSPPSAPEPHCPEPETVWEVPATSAGAVADRNPARLFGFQGCRPVDSLLVDNTRCATMMQLQVNGRLRRVPAGGRLEINQVGPIEGYIVIPTAAVSAADCVVYERRFGNGGVQGAKA